MSITIMNSLGLLRTISTKVFQTCSIQQTLFNQTSNSNNILYNIVTSTSTSLIPIRTNIRCHFPRPNERMRIKKHGYKKRLTTQAGLRVLLRRILKGRHNISH
ncbi:uncharacterized protein LOC123293694 [Chrysoperla carnea]|uniref:uncharacterized protein LOC123293694 n=1 Tax=Chrysoperla carnea TaxID=189513 RepID=UPI001D092EF9|nr:uncharacterized protein LOC123293694 [Chrysoperla carnea]